MRVPGHTSMLRLEYKIWVSKAKGEFPKKMYAVYREGQQSSEQGTWMTGMAPSGQQSSEQGRNMEGRHGTIGREVGKSGGRQV